MPRDSETNACERVAALLDALPDGDFGSRDLAFLDRHTATCPSCALERELALEVAQGLARLPRFHCPPAVASRVLQAAAGDAAKRRPPFERLRAAARQLPDTLLRGLGLGGLWRPALAAGAAALVAAVLVVSQARHRAPAYSPEEVAQAQAELELAFAYLGRMGDETGALVRKELVEHMITPAFRAMGPAGRSTEGTR